MKRLRVMVSMLFLFIVMPIIGGAIASLGLQSFVRFLGYISKCHYTEDTIAGWGMGGLVLGLIVTIIMSIVATLANEKELNMMPDIVPNITFATKSKVTKIQ